MASVTTLRRIVLIVLFVAVAAVAVVVVVQNRSDSPHLPRVTVTSVGGPGRDEWTITIASHGSGFGYSALVIETPDGHRHESGGTLLEDSATGPHTLTDLVPGDYRYFVYGVATSNKLSWYAIPPRDQTARNLIASGSFSIF
jgi:hypothetical protein